MQTLKERIKKALNVPETDFANHCSDLHLKYSHDREKWLRENYEFWCNVKIYTANIKESEWYGKRFFDIPFAYTEYHTKGIVY